MFLVDEILKYIHTKRIFQRDLLLLVLKGKRQDVSFWREFPFVQYKWTLMLGTFLFKLILHFCIQLQSQTWNTWSTSTLTMILTCSRQICQFDFWIIQSKTYKNCIHHESCLIFGTENFHIHLVPLTTFILCYIHEIPHYPALAPTHARTYYVQRIYTIYTCATNSNGLVGNIQMYK